MSGCINVQGNRTLFCSICVLCLSLFVTYLSFAQIPVILTYPREDQVDISTNASVAKNEGEYIYVYTLVSSEASVQRAWEFSIFRIDFVDSAENSIGWMFGRSVVPQDRVTWGSSDSTFDLYPGNSTTGFTLFSRGLPSIKDYYVRGFVEVPSADEEPDSIAGGDFPENCFHGITIGPVAIPPLFEPLLFLDSLSSLVVQSRLLSWITTQPIADKYTHYFDTTRSRLQSANVKGAITTLQTVLAQANLDSSSTLTSEAYALIRYNTEYLINALLPTHEVKGGIFNPSGNTTLSVKAKPSVTFTSADTLIALTATIRWKSDSPLTLGAVSSPVYGFTKLDSVVTVSGYKCQKFRTTSHAPLNWAAGNEYELFTVPVNGSSGAEDFELTNALSGGEWFVDINYLDKTDSAFYQPLAHGFAWWNKSENWAATYDNSARHIAMTSTKLHEAFTSAGEIIYRRKNISTDWEVTRRISAGDGSNGNSCITLDHANAVHVLWQHQHGTSLVFDLCYNRSTDGGTTWGSTSVIKSSVVVNSSQWEIYPVIAEYSTTQLIAVYTTSTGLQYKKSTNGGTSWSDYGPIGTPSSGSTIWFLSLARGSNFLTLSYDTRSTGVYATKFNGSAWSTPTNISSAVGTIYDRYSSVAIDGSNIPMASWCAQRSGRNEYRIVYRLGVAGGDSWSRTYVEWTQRPTGVSDFYPSIHCFQGGGGINYREILWQTTDNQVPMLQWVYGNWYTSTLSTSGLWANTALSYGGRAWTDQSSTPYQITLSSYDGSLHLESLMQPGSNVQLQRRLTLESESSGSFVSFELSPLKLVTAKGDTTVLPFKPIDWEKPLVLSEAKAWEYLGTDNVSLPSNAKYLVFDADIQTVTRQDSSGQKASINVFTGKSLDVSIVKGVQKTQVLTDTKGESGRKVVDISSFAGQTVSIRPVGEATSKPGELISVAVGDIYAPKQ
jgi:hypothetical protein